MFPRCRKPVLTFLGPLLLPVFLLPIRPGGAAPEAASASASRAAPQSQSSGFSQGPGSLLAQVERAVLAIASRPGGADIFINGKDVGKTWEDGFREWEVPPGAYTIALYKDGYEVFKYRYEVGPGERREIWPWLEPMSGPVLARTRVPSLRNRLQGDAVSLLRNRNLRVQVSGFEVTQNARLDGRVARQDPRAGTPVLPGTVVVLTPYRYRPVPVTVPSVIDRTVASAQTVLRGLGLNSRVAGSVDTPDEGLGGRVARQSPEPNRRVARGTVVTLTPYRYAYAGPAAWTRGAPMPTPRWTPKVAAIRGILYAAGGYDGTADTSAMEAYNIAAGVWERLPPLPRVDPGNAGRYGGAMGVIDGRLLMAGGWRIRPPLPTRTLLIYDPADRTWRRGANMPILSGCSVSGVIGKKLYVLTACDGYSGFRKRLHVYDAAADRWTERAPAPRFHADGAGAAIGGKFYVVGGGVWGKPTAALDVYDPVRNAWTARAPMPTVRSAFAAGALNGKLYVLGGVGARNSRLSTLEIYDPATNTWATGPPMLTPRSGLGVAVFNGRLYAVGGHDGKRPVAVLEVLAP